MVSNIESQKKNVLYLKLEGRCVMDKNEVERMKMIDERNKIALSSFLRSHPNGRVPLFDSKKPQNPH